MEYLLKCAILTLLTPLGATEEGLDNSPTASGITSLDDLTVVMKRTSRNTVRQISVDSPALLPPPYLQLPVFQHSRLPLVEKEYFNPAYGTGYEPLPVEVREVLFPVSPTAKPPTPSIQSRGVTTWCNVTKMHVHVQKSILGADGSSSHLKFGTCHASKSTKDLLYFEYDLGLCGNKRAIINNRVAYSNTLRYDPPKLTGPIRRAVPFTLPIACHYNRYYYSYKIGYIPKIQMRKIFKPMKNRAKFILTPHNAQWERLSPSDWYMMGKPMYFQAEATSEGLAKDGRLYVHSCHATRRKSHTSMPQFPVVENFGCMVESKASRSRFIPYKKNIVRFSVDAFLFKGMTGQQLYMHCAMSVGGSVPTSTAKSCNYDTKAQRWQELYDSTSVCSCCDSKCSSAAPTVTKMVSSIPWSVEYIDPTTTPKRTVKPKTTPKTPQPKEKGKGAAKIEVEELVRGLKWPFGGGGVTWTEEEGDKSVKGFAVVQEEKVSEPRIIPWSVEYIDPTTTPKRTVKPKTTPKGMIFKLMTTPVAIMVTMTPTTKSRTMTKKRKTPQPKERGKGMAKIEVEELVRGLKWPLGGGGVTWTEEEGDKSVKGFAVVQVEKVSEPRIIPWSVEYIDPTTTPKRTVKPKTTPKGMIFKLMTTPVAIMVTTTPTTKSRTMMTKKRKTPQPKERGKGMAKIEVEELVRGLKWPFGGGGVTWTEEEGDKSVKGFAVVQVEKVSEPRIIPWSVEYIDPSTTPKRTVKPKTTPKGMIFKLMTTPVAIMVTTTPTTKSRTMTTKKRKTPQPKERGKGMAKIEVEELVRGLKWPFGGGGVTWTEEEGDKSVKGFAVVQVEKVSEPRIIPWSVEYIDPTTTPKRTVKPKTTPKGIIFKPWTTQRRMRVTTPVERDEKSMKGFAVVEEEQVPETRRIFEDIFGLDK